MQGVPPLTGAAMVRELEEGRAQWELALTMPSESWEATKGQMPDLRWPEIKQTVTQGSIYEGTMRLPFGDSSDPAFFRAADIGGRELTLVQIVEQLKTKQPVLVSVDGRMPDARHFGLATHAKLIVLLGPGDMRDTPKAGSTDDKAAALDKATKAP